MFPHALESNEWLVKLPVRHHYGKTYNPDYFCAAFGSYIELVTSCPCISAYREKWAKAIKQGYRVRVFWWRGHEITEFILRRMSPGQIMEAIYLKAIAARRNGKLGGRSIVKKKKRPSK